jgi:hypothetical protein
VTLLPADPPAAPPSLSDDTFAGGLALLDAQGVLLAVSPAARAWAAGDTARILTARTAALGKPQYDTDLSDLQAARLLIAAPAAGGQSLITALPIAAGIL